MDRKDQRVRKGFQLLSWQEAEDLSGQRLDRRRKYAIDWDDEYFPGAILSYGEWTASCTGCHETFEGHEVGTYPRDKNGVSIGAGCSECGYTGKRRHGYWSPYIPSDLDCDSGKVVTIKEAACAS